MAMVASLVTLSGPSQPIILHVLDAGLRSACSNALERLCLGSKWLEVHWVEVPDAFFHQLPSRHNLPKEAFMRLALPDALADIEKVIWLDCDTLILSSLTDLWKTDLGGSPLAAVREYGALTIREMLSAKVATQINHKFADSAGFNSGVMLIDLKSWRSNQIASQVLAFSRQNSDHLLFADQDGLNAILGSQWKPLDLSWNVQVGAIRSMTRLLNRKFPEELIARREQLLECPRIIHFAGDKPWNSGLLSPFRNLYFESLRLSRYYSPWRFLLHCLACNSRAAGSYATNRLLQLHNAYLYDRGPVSVKPN